MQVFQWPSNRDVHPAMLSHSGVGVYGYICLYRNCKKSTIIWRTTCPWCQCETSPSTWRRSCLVSCLRFTGERATDSDPLSSCRGLKWRNGGFWLILILIYLFHMQPGRYMSVWPHLFWFEWRGSHQQTKGIWHGPRHWLLEGEILKVMWSILKYCKVVRHTVKAQNSCSINLGFRPIPGIPNLDRKICLSDRLHLQSRHVSVDALARLSKASPRFHLAAVSQTSRPVLASKSCFKSACGGLSLK